MAFWLGIFVVIGVAIWAVVHFSQSSPVTSSGTAAPITDADHVRGTPDATVQLVEYSDFQCPACAAIQPFIQQILDQFGDRITFTYRHYPLTTIHPNAERAAQAAEAAAVQGKFWEYHDLLFDRQSVWSSERNPDQLFLQYANELGLNTEWFAGDLDSSTGREKIQVDTASGDRAGVRGTPSFFLNGQPLTFTSYEQFRQLIADAVAAR